jgi:hypothetical protein
MHAAGETPLVRNPVPARLDVEKSTIPTSNLTLRYLVRSGFLDTYLADEAFGLTAGQNQRALLAAISKCCVNKTTCT